MPLEDFFAKRDKKKTRKKQNPEDLMRELVNDRNTKKENDVTSEIDPTKIVPFLKDDEWEAIDDGEKEIDLTSIRINKLTVETSEDYTTNKNDDSTGAAEEVKPVWGAKPSEQPSPAKVAPPEPEPLPPSHGIYIPVHLRQATMNATKANKPNLASESDFPTLDIASAVAAPTSATTSKVTVKSPEAPAEDNEGWEQPSVPRRSARAIESTISSGAYVPPSLRQATVANSEFETRGPRFSEDRFRYSKPPSRSDGFGSSMTTGSTNGWSRGGVITQSTDSTHPTRTQFLSKSLHPQSNPSKSTWERGSNVKTFTDTGREKPGFELVQSNRFAGLSGT